MSYPLGANYSAFYHKFSLLLSITSVAPKDLQYSTLCEDPTTAQIFDPFILSIYTNIDPTPPPAEWTKTLRGYYYVYLKLISSNNA